MKNIIAVLLVTLFLVGCAAHVWNNTHPPLSLIDRDRDSSEQYAEFLRRGGLLRGPSWK